MNAIQKRLAVDKYCSECPAFVSKGSAALLHVFGCHIEAVRSHYVSDIKDFVLCRSTLDKISKEKGRTKYEY